MNKKLTTWIAVLIVLIAGGLIAFDQIRNKTGLPEADIVSVVYADADEDVFVSADFNNTDGTVTFSHKDIGEHTLPSVVSASGAKYANEDESIVFWEHQGEVTLSYEDLDIFIGYPIEITKNEEIVGEIESAIVGTWVWERNIMSDDSIITPNQEGAFSVSFTEEGKVYGTTDCNNFLGRFETFPAEGLDTLGEIDLVNGEIKFGDLASTLMYCEDSQEELFTSYLADTYHYIIYEGEELFLNIKYDSGNMQFTKKQ